MAFAGASAGADISGDGCTLSGLGTVVIEGSDALGFGGEMDAVEGPFSLRGDVVDVLVVGARLASLVGIAGCPVCAGEEEGASGFAAGARATAVGRFGCGWERTPTSAVLLASGTAGVIVPGGRAAGRSRVAVDAPVSEVGSAATGAGVRLAPSRFASIATRYKAA